MHLYINHFYSFGGGYTIQNVPSVTAGIGPSNVEIIERDVSNMVPVKDVRQTSHNSWFRLQVKAFQCTLSTFQIITCCLYL